MSAITKPIERQGDVVFYGTEYATLAVVGRRPDSMPYIRIGMGRKETFIGALDGARLRGFLQTLAGAMGYRVARRGRGERG